MAAISTSFTTLAINAPTFLKSTSIPAQKNVVRFHSSFNPSALSLRTSTTTPSHGSRTLKAGAARATAQENVEEVAAPAETAKKPRKTKSTSAVPKKQRIMLRFLWLEKNVGIALDQLIPGQGTVPLSPYMFWPRKDAWEQLKELLDSKPWISRKRTIILLNQATDIINLWQQTTFKP
eukprot:jgi/Mesen1/7243/ME000373S06315